MKLLLAIFITTITTITVQANELVLSLAEAKKQGFVVQKKYKAPFSNTRFKKTMMNYRANQLAWPFEHPFKDGFIGNNSAQYQPYETPAYHGGSDMVLENDSWMYAPVSGLLEAGHYAYTDNPDGSKIKHWKAWPQTGSATYFEVAVIDSNGNRFELHHVDRSTLPQDIIEGLNKGNFKVQAGVKVGRVLGWSTPFHYDHVHVNVIDQEGTWYNPEHFFQLLPDTISPKCRVMAMYKNNKTAWVEPGFKISSDIANFIAVVSDQKLNNDFSQVPQYFELKFQEGGLFFWDFRKTLTSSDASFADFRQVYAGATKLPTGQTMRQPGDFYPRGVQFMVKLPIPTNTGNGSFQILVQDMAGNKCIVKN